MSPRRNPDTTQLSMLPNPGAAKDVYGPFRAATFDTDHVFNRTLYAHIPTRSKDWTVMSESDASDYLPKGQTRHVRVGIKTRETVSIPRFDTVALANYTEYKQAYILNTGGSVWGLAFAPKRPDVDSDPSTEYLAVGGYLGNDEEHHSFHEHQTDKSYKNCIQIWKCRLSVKEPTATQRLDVCLLHDFGTVLDLSWCPWGAYEESTEHDWLPKLGILAVAFGDGTTRVIVVPHPVALREHLGQTESTQPIYLRIERTACTFKLPSAAVQTLAWGGHKILSCGYSNGSIVLWDIASGLAQDTGDPSYTGQSCVMCTIAAHFSTVRYISWQGIDDPVLFISGGNDGRLMVFDVRDPSVGMLLYRSRAIMQALSWDNYTDLIAYSDADDFFRCTRVTDFQEQKLGSKLAANKGRTTEIAHAIHHPFYALSSGDGWVKVVNGHLDRIRGKNDYQFVAYKLDYDSENDTYTFVDGIPSMNCDTVRDLPDYYIAMENTISIARVAWSPNWITCGHLASGGTSGLVRIDFVGRGKGWD